MSRHIKIGKYQQLFLLLAVTALIPIVARPQAVSSERLKNVEESLAKDGTLPSKLPTFQIQLETVTPMVCIGSSLNMEIEITNTGQDTITLDKVDLWSSFSFSYDHPDSEYTGIGGGSESGCSHCRGNYIVIPPGATYWEAHEVSLGSFSFFKKAGKYTLSTRIHSVSSNDVKFELYECGNANEEAKQK